MVNDEHTDAEKDEEKEIDLGEDDADFGDDEDEKEEGTGFDEFGNEQE